MEDDERDELQRLQREMELSSLGDKPYSIAAVKLQRLIELESQASKEPLDPFCRVCRSRHQLKASLCPAMWDIA